MELTKNKKLTTEDMATAASSKRHIIPVDDQSEKDRPEVREHRPPTADVEEVSPLLSTEEEEAFRSRWNAIQTGFVDEPRSAVEQADELVAETMQRLAKSFSKQKSNLETQWEQSDEVSTEELRMALRRYRSFFDRLLSI